MRAKELERSMWRDTILHDRSLPPTSPVFFHDHPRHGWSRGRRPPPHDRAANSQHSYHPRGPATAPQRPAAAAFSPLSRIPPPSQEEEEAKSAGCLSIFSSCRPLSLFTFHCHCHCHCCCRIPTAPLCLTDPRRRTRQGTCITGTLFGYRKGRVSLALQEAPKRLPTLVVDLGIQTHVLFKEMSSGKKKKKKKMKKRKRKRKRKTKMRFKKKKKKEHVGLLDEPLWTVFFNGKKSGYGVKRDPTEDDLAIMEVLDAVSTGAGVLPGRSDVEGPDGELAYMRAGFEHVVGSRDSETLYLISPDGGISGPDFTIFFVRV